VFELSAYQHSDIAQYAHTFFGSGYHPRLVDVNVDGGPLVPICPTGDTRAENTVFEQMALQGQSMFGAEGDHPGLFWCGATGAGGGRRGSSQYWGRPFYQIGKGVNNPYTTYANSTTQCTLAKTRTPCREAPDVSANADESPWRQASWRARPARAARSSPAPGRPGRSGTDSVSGALCSNGA
jgi:hypothetical protein